ncbi:MAG: sortase [Pseudonocardiales bacterium]|nr:sortase [Pseudonocardiales bacterium]
MTTLQDPPAPPHEPRDEARRRGRPTLPRIAVRRPNIRIPRRRVQHTPGSLILNWALALVAGLVCWLLLYGFLISSLQQAHDQSVLYDKFRQQLAEATAPVGGPITPGNPVAVLDIPAAGLHREVIVEGTLSGELAKGPGHRRDTPLPGQPGVSVIYGRAALFGAPFHSIASLRPGATVTTTTAEGTATYVVDRVRRAGDSFPALVSGGRLTLVTSDASGWHSGWAPGGVVYVDATLVSKPFADSGVRPSLVPEAERAMKGDTGALYSLVLWLPAPLLAALGIVWAADRWGRWQAWLIGTPIALAALWGVTQTAVQFLPNLM